MLASRNASGGVLLRGLPQQLVAIAPMPPGGVGWLRVDLDVPGHTLAVPLMALAAPSGLPDYVELRLSLPGTVPAGRYGGKIWLGERAVALSVEIEANPTLRTVPESMQTEARAGGEVTVAFALLNTGNVPYEVRSSYVFGMVDAKALDRALSRTTGAELPAGATPTSASGRADRLVDELAEGRGGPVRIEVREGAGPLQPSEVREVRATLKLPERLRPGRTYSGVWALDEAAFSVRVTIIDGGSEEELR